MKTVLKIGLLFRRSPLALAKLKKLQIDEALAAGNKNFQPRGCLGTALTRWSGEADAAIRNMQLLPLMQQIPPTSFRSWKGAERAQYTQGLDDAVEAWKDLKYFLAIQKHLDHWVTVLQR